MCRISTPSKSETSVLRDNRSSLTIVCPEAARLWFPPLVECGDGGTVALTPVLAFAPFTG